MSVSNVGRADWRLPGLYVTVHPDRSGVQSFRFLDDAGDPIAFTSVDLVLEDLPPVPATPDEPGAWTLPVAAPGLGTYLGHVYADGVPVVRVSVTGDLSPGRGPDLGDRVLRLVDGGTVELTVVGGSGGGSSLPPVAGDGIEVAGFLVSVDATVVREGDERLSDARQPLPHSHSATDVSGLAAVATTGDYGDLSGAPTIPSTPGEVGADPAGAADSAVQGHVAASDPHGDRSYTDQTVAGLDADTIGAVPADGLPVRIVDDGATTTVTGAGTPADPLVITSLGGGGGGGGAGWELIAEVDWTEDAALDVLFDDIPQTFKHLRVEALLYRTTTGAGSASMRFNGDDTAIYSNSGDPANGTDTELNVGVVKNGGTWRTIDIPWYRRTPAGLGYRLVRITEAGTLTGGNDNYSAGVRASAWRSLNPITSIEIYTNPSTTATGSVVSLYGWKD